MPGQLEVGRLVADPRLGHGYATLRRGAHRAGERGHDVVLLEERGGARDSSARSRSSSAGKLDRTTTRLAGLASRMPAIASRPLMPGIDSSRSTTCGMELRRLVDAGARVRRLARHLDVALAVEHGPHEEAERLVVVAVQHAEHSRATITGRKFSGLATLDA